MVQLVAGFFQLAESVEMAAGLGFYPADRNRLESQWFEGRNGRKAVVARDSNEIERRRVRAICLAASEQGPSRTSTKAQRACDFQLHPECALSRLPVERVAEPVRNFVFKA